MFYTVAQKVNIYLGNFSEKDVNKNFQKSPNLVTLLGWHSSDDADASYFENFYSIWLREN